MKPATRAGFKISRDDKIRTCDPLHPMQVRYRAALRPVHKRGANISAKTKFQSILHKILYFIHEDSFKRGINC